MILMTGITYSCFLCHNMDIHVIIYMYVDIRVIIHVHCYSAYKRLFDRFYNNVCSQAIDPFCENGVISESVKIKFEFFTTSISMYNYKFYDINLIY